MDGKLWEEVFYFPRRSTFPGVCIHWGGFRGQYGGSIHEVFGCGNDLCSKKSCKHSALEVHDSLVYGWLREGPNCLYSGMDIKNDATSIM